MTGLPSRRGVIKGAAAVAAASFPLPLAAAPTVHEVEIRAFAFVPADLDVRVGDVVRWTNADLAPHTATTDTWDTGTLRRGQRAELRIEVGMETAYWCVFHPHMTGRIRIVD